MQPAEVVELRVDGGSVVVRLGATLLDACDKAGRYVPRLCCYPGLACCLRPGVDGAECGLCAVRLGEGPVVLACATLAAAQMKVSTDDPGLRALRSERLAVILAQHPHVCLTCSDRDGCTREECTYGNPPESRCCDEYGRCELGKVAGYINSGHMLRPSAVAVCREATVEGRIRREPGLCVGCGRCVVACETLPGAGRALELVGMTEAVPASDGRVRARPKLHTLRASGCTFCGQCVIVCPTGALTAPGTAGARWLTDRRAESALRCPVLPPDTWRAVSPGSLATVPCLPGVFRLMDRAGEILRIGGVADLRQGVARAVEEPTCATVAYFQVEVEPLFTQRESELLARYTQENGHLPVGNDLGDDMFAEDAESDDFF